MLDGITPHRGGARLPAFLAVVASKGHPFSLRPSQLNAQPRFERYFTLEAAGARFPLAGGDINFLRKRYRALAADHLRRCPANA